MAKKNSYWDKRFLDLDKKVFETSEEYVKEIRKVYDREIDRLNKEIYGHLTKLQDEAGNITLAEARKLLNDNELELFKMNLKDFTEKAQGIITPEIEKELNIVSRRVRISRLQAMQVEIKKTVANLMSREEKSLFAHMGRTYEYKYYTELYGLQRIFGYKNIQRIDKDILKDIIYSPWASDGSNFSKRIWDRGDKLVNLLQDNLSRDIARGAAPDESIKNIARLMNTSKANAGRLVMTESAAINSRATRDSYSQMGTEQYQILATLDTRTSDICRSLDDKVYDVKDYRIGITAPPFHPNCRTTTVPYFDDEIQRRLDGRRMARNPETGKSERVENLSYREWEKKYVKSKNITIEDKVKGKARSKTLSEDSKEKFEKLNEYFETKYDILIDEPVFELDYDAVEETMNGVEFMIGEFPELGYTLEYVGTYSDAAMSCDGREIHFNPKHYKNYGKLDELVKYQGEIGNWVKDSDIASTGVHETSHGLEWLLSQLNPDYNTGKEMYDAWDNGLEAKKIVLQAIKDIKNDDAFKYKSNKEIILELSKNALDNESETLAEAFADIYLHGDNAHHLSLKIKELTHKLLKIYRGE